ncbi:MAG TPA: nucleotidyltransferase domain-containing protein [Nocardioides sp.]|nr:nucleotidyltransferase domain-containing protein [Nocardioides sp.]
MSLLAQYREARRDEDVARLRRILALRALGATGMSQRQVAQALGVSQPAVSQQLKAGHQLGDVHPEVLIEAAAPILRSIAAEHGYSDPAVFGSVARHDARADSDIDLIVKAPEGTSSFDFIRFQRLLEQVLGREIDLVEYGGLRPGRDDDVRREAVLL